MNKTIIRVNYIKNEKDGGYIYPGGLKFGRSSLGAVKLLCRSYLFTLEGYLISIKRVLPLKYKIPIVCSSRLALIYTKSLKNYDTVFVNIFEVKDYKVINKSLELTFYDGSGIIVDLTLKTYKRLVDTILYILIYKESLP